MNCNSVRNRPMPAAPVSSICGRSMTRPALIISAIVLAVLGDAGLVAQREILRLPARAQFDALDIGALDVRRRPHMHVAGRAVDDDGVARFDKAGGVGDLADGRNAERARHDRDVRGRAAFFEHEAAQSLAVIIEQRRRPHRARDENGVVRQLLARRRVILAHQHAHQPVGEVVEIVQAVAQIGIGGAQHAGAGVGLHALDAGFGGQAGPHRFAHLVRASPGRRRTCGRLRARRGARRRRRRRRARACGRDRRATWRSRRRGA